MHLCIDFVQEDGTLVPDVILRAHTREGLTQALSVDLAHTASEAFADATLAVWESDWNPEGFSFSISNGNDTRVKFTYVPDDTEISEWDTEYDAEQASMEAGTYPPRFVPELRTVRVIIHEYERDKIIGTTEITGESFQEVSVFLMQELILSWPISQVVSAMVKWFGGPPMVGDGQPFDVRQYEPTVGFWTDFLYRP